MISSKAVDEIFILERTFAQVLTEAVPLFPVFESTPTTPVEGYAPRAELCKINFGEEISAPMVQVKKRDVPQWIFYALSLASKCK